MWGRSSGRVEGGQPPRRLRVGSAQEFILPSLASEYVRVLAGSLVLLHDVIRAPTLEKTFVSRCVFGL